MVRTRWLLAAALVPLLGCESKITTTVDTELQQRVLTVKDCFPGLYPRLEALLTIARCWRLDSDVPVPDPVGVFVTVGSEPGGTVVTVQYPAGGTVITMAIRCYSPSGVQQTIVLAGAAASTLNEVVRAVAVGLRTQFPGDEQPFVVGDFAIAGGGIVAEDEALLGLVGGPAAAPRLTVVRTCSPSNTIAGGPPQTEGCTITDLGPPVCAIRFATSDLALDDSPAQAYPIGTVDLSLDGPRANVVAAVAFDGTRTIRIVVDGVRGRFTFDTEARVLAYVP